MTGRPVTFRAGALSVTGTLNVVTPKPVGGGLVTVDYTKLPNVAKYGLKDGVVKIPWATVNPQPGVFDWSVLEGILATYSTNGLAFRIQSGAGSPGWLDQLTGTVSVLNRARNIRTDVCHWWEDVAMDAWRDMIRAAGARFDDHPGVVLVSADAPMVAFSEPFILGSDDDSAKALVAAGLTLERHKAAIARCVDDTAAAFPRTPVELAVHPTLQYPTAAGMRESWEEARALMLTLALRHGKHLVLSDYGLGVTDTAASHVTTKGDLTSKTDLYDWLAYRTTAAAGAARGPVAFQLTPNGLTTVDHYAAMAQNAIDLRAYRCETSTWGQLGTRATALNAALLANVF